MVVGHHTTSKLQSYPSTSGNHLFLGGALQDGWFGVDFFFVLSGFIIALSLSKAPTIQTFMYRRFTRIFLPFWIIFALTLAVALAVPNGASHFRVIEWHEWILAVALLPSGKSAPVIGVAWTLHHEVLFYAVAACWLIRPKLALLLASSLLFLPLIVPAEQFPEQFIFSPLHWEFVIGIAAFLLHQRLTQQKAMIAIGAGIAWIAMIWFFAPAENDAYGPQRVIHYGIGLGLLCTGLAAFERNTAISSNSRINTWGSALGDWSYSLYLLHIPIIIFSLRLASGVMPLDNILATNVMGLIAMAICVSASFTFNTYIEKPLLKNLYNRPMVRS